MTFAVVPACGHSTRMGQPKLTLPLAEETVIEKVVKSLRGGGVEKVLAIVGPHVPELASLARSAGADVLTLTEPTPDMRATVERGLDWLEERHHPTPHDVWLLAPADHAAFSPTTVQQLLAAARCYPARSIIIPTFQEKRGHPALLHWRHVEGIRLLLAGQGINAYLQLHADEVMELPVNDAGILLNLDTPEDYEGLRRE
jgi:molybdenum cofactor cytidylyltransferase